MERYFGIKSLCRVKSSWFTVRTSRFKCIVSVIALFPHPKGRKGIRSNFKGALVDPVEKPPENASATLGSVAVNSGESLAAGSGFIAVVVEDYGRRSLVF